jgi:hypothetical protein
MMSKKPSGLYINFERKSIVDGVTLPATFWPEHAGGFSVPGILIGLSISHGTAKSVLMSNCVLRQEAFA